MKNSNDAIGNRTRELPACSAGLQATEPPCAPVKDMRSEKFYNDTPSVVALNSKARTTHQNKSNKLNSAMF